MRKFIAVILFLGFSLYADDSYEPNDTFSQAKEISYGTYQLEGDNEDWFKINVKPGMLYIKMDPSTSVDLNMVLYNANNQVVKADFQPNMEAFQYHVSVAGEYYIQVAPTSELHTSYQLEVSNALAQDGDDANDEQNGNDTIENATILASARGEVKNQVLLDDDWFKVKVYPGVFKIDLAFDYQNVTDDIKLEVYNSNYTRIAHSINETPSASGRSLEIEVTEEEEYYIAVWGENEKNYALNVNLPTIWTKKLDFGPIRDTSAALFDIDNDGKDEIFIGTSKALDEENNEVRVAGFVCLEDTGEVKWAAIFPAINGIDTQTGKTYLSTSVTTAPAFGDIDSDGNIDIVVGVGGESTDDTGLGVSGQPGDKGGVYALNGDGSIKWFHESLDTIGGSENVGDGRGDGVYGTPVIFDIDSDGTKEVIYNSWDQHVWILEGSSGAVKPNWPLHLLDTIWSTPKITDINKDGTFEILVSADVTENSDAGTQTGGVFHVLTPDGEQNVSGFNDFIGNPNYPTLKGKYEEQTLWSSPVAADIDNDGFLEIIYGTGNFFHNQRGSYIRVWKHNGTQLFQLATVGRTFATLLVCDLENDGDLEIIATTLEGYVFCWDHTGKQLFATQTQSYKASTPQPIFSSPVAVDIDNDGKLEIIYAQGTQTIIINAQGEQINDFTQREMVFESYKGALAVKDIDKDGILDFISGGTTASKDQAMIYRWQYSSDQNDHYRSCKNQLSQSQTGVEAFVSRFYVTVLNRAEIDAGGLNYWVDQLSTGLKSGEDAAKGFISSQEFRDRGLSDDAFLSVIYEAFFNRAADQGGYDYWDTKLKSGMSFDQVTDGFVDSNEFEKLCNDYGILPFKPQSEIVSPVESFVTRFYQQCLEREPDAGGLAHWTSQLKAQEITGADVANGFVMSSEFIARNVDVETFVTILYRAFFDREPDTGGFNGWVSNLNNAAMTRQDVLNGFLGAEEFANLCSKYGIIAQ